MLRWITLLALPVALLPLAACAGPSTGSAAVTPLRVTVRDYRSQLAFTLRSGDDRERVSYYSQKRDDASTKIQSPEIMEALVRLFRDSGLEPQLASGPAPQATGAATKSIELEDARGTRHLLRRPGMSAESARAFEEFVVNFLAVYQETYALQAVDDSNDPRGPSRSDDR